VTPPPAPIRFLLLVVGCWVGVRALTLLSGPASQDAADIIAAAPAKARTASAAAPSEARTSFGQPGPLGATSPSQGQGARPPRSTFALAYLPVSSIPRTAPSPAALAVSPPLASSPVPAPRPATPHPVEARTFAPPAFALPNASPASRWTGSAWVFHRDDTNGGTLAPGGALGGSQAGLRLTYRLNNDSRRPLSLSARLYTPLDAPRGAEAALGIDWRPIAALPINLLAERRQAVGRDGRSDFALMLHGGTETRIARGRIRIEAYGQAGIVGIERRDLFADGAITATARIGPVDVGGGAWGGAQPGVSRLDLGPHAGFRLPVGRATIRAAAEWRFRVAGDATPGSGPALTISAGF